MPLSLALLAEPNASLRRLIGTALRHVGYEVSEAANELQLKLKLFSSTILIAEDALLVLDRDIARHCVSELGALFRVRARVPSPAARFILMCEPGQGGALQATGLDRRQLAGVLQKPFDLHELERLARGGPDRALG